MPRGGVRCFAVDMTNNDPTGEGELSVGWRQKSGRGGWLWDLGERVRWPCRSGFTYSDDEMAKGVGRVAWCVARDSGQWVGG